MFVLSSSSFKVLSAKSTTLLIPPAIRFVLDSSLYSWKELMISVLSAPMSIAASEKLSHNSFPCVELVWCLGISSWPWMLTVMLSLPRVLPWVSSIVTEYVNLRCSELFRKSSGHAPPPTVALYSQVPSEPIFSWSSAFVIAVSCSLESEPPVQVISVSSWIKLNSWFAGRFMCPVCSTTTVISSVSCP